MLKKSKKKSNKKPSRSESVKKNSKKPTLKSLKKEKSVLKKIMINIFFFCFGLGIIFCGYIYLTLPDIEDAKSMYRRAKITITADNGEVIGVFGDKYKHPVLFEEIPNHFIDALVFTEDKRFFSHFGFDFIAITRAFITNFQTGKKSSGASTITQQLAKNLFLTNEKTYIRKIREFMLALILEFKFSKQQILTLYLNRAYFGSGVYGIEGAADYYYGKKASELNEYESVSLIAMLKSPLGYNPIINPEKSKDRTMLLLKKMDIDNISYVHPMKRIGGNYGYFNDWVYNQMLTILGEINQDIIIKTTLDLAWQKKIETNIKMISDELQVAVVAVDYNGGVKAMLGGKDYNKSQFNRAVQAYRQQGSLLKPFAYLYGLENGYALDFVVEDIPFTINGWSPKNASETFYGDITFSEALIKSLNTIPVRLLNAIGIDKFKSFLNKFGINADCSDSAVIVLGACENTLMNVVGGYGSLASGGYAVYPFGINKIENNKGEILYERHIRDKSRIVEKENVDALNEVLEEVVARGTGKKGYIEGMNIKGKTGTSQDYRDAFFVGFDRGIVVGVWVGKDDNTPMKKIGGGSIPAKLFKEIMQ